MEHLGWSNGRGIPLHLPAKPSGKVHQSCDVKAPGTENQLWVRSSYRPAQIQAAVFGNQHLAAWPPSRRSQYRGWQLPNPDGSPIANLHVLSRVRSFPNSVVAGSGQRTVSSIAIPRALAAFANHEATSSESQHCRNGSHEGQTRRMLCCEVRISFPASTSRGRCGQSEERSSPIVTNDATALTIRSVGSDTRGKASSAAASSCTFVTWTAARALSSRSDSALS